MRAVRPAGKSPVQPSSSRDARAVGAGERTVDSLATELGISVANASQHLQALRQAALVESRKDGLFVHYRLAGPEVFDLSKVIRSVAERRLAELERLVHEHFGNRADAEAVPMDELLKRARSSRSSFSTRGRHASTLDTSRARCPFPSTICSGV